MSADLSITLLQKCLRLLREGFKAAFRSGKLSAQTVNRLLLCRHHSAQLLKLCILPCSIGLVHILCIVIQRGCVIEGLSQILQVWLYNSHQVLTALFVVSVGKSSLQRVCRQMVFSELDVTG